MTPRIVGWARTPVGALSGSLKDAPPERLGAVAFAAALERAGLAREQLSELVLGSVLSAGRGPNPAQGLLTEGQEDVDVATYGFTVRAGGASGLEAMARALPDLGPEAAASVVAADSASRAPYLLPEARSGSRLGGARLLDGALRDAWGSPEDDLPLTAHAALLSRSLGIDRDALLSLRSRSAERARGAPRDEVVAVPVPGAKGEILVKEDDLPGARDPVPGDEAFAAPLADGAASLVVAGETLARGLGRAGAPRIIAFARTVVDPRRAPLAPVAALRTLLSKCQRRAADLVHVEIDESLTAAPVAARSELEIDDGRLNPRGGAHAYGYSIGACGLRALVTLLDELSRRGGGLGAVAYGAGGGAAVAVAVEAP